LPHIERWGRHPSITPIRRRPAANWRCRPTAVLRLLEMLARKQRPGVS
jgi:hypothetical protein